MAVSTSELVKLTSFALESSVTLYNTFQNFKSHPKNVRDLTEELCSLGDVLRQLEKTVKDITDIDLTALEQPLRQCSKACKKLNETIAQCSSRSGGDRTSFRDWAKIKYMGDNINTFKDLLAGYKSTIIVALADANLQKSSFNAASLEQYKELVRNATNDLEDRLQHIDDKLEQIVEHTRIRPDARSVELQLVQDERASTEQCLQICAQLSEHINQIQANLRQHSRSSSVNPPSEPTSERITYDGLQECRESLRVTSAKLESHLQDVLDRLITESTTSNPSQQNIDDVKRLREEWAAARKCIDICSQAESRMHNISTIDSYATGDAVQLLVSTDGKTIRGKQRGYGWRTQQFGGHCSNDVLKDFIAKIASPISQSDDAPRLSATCDNSGSPPDMNTEAKIDLDYRGRYGQGRTLPNRPPVNISPKQSSGERNGRYSPPQ